MTPQRVSDDLQAPFGYDEDGTVIAPFGLKANGDPRLSNRGRSAGSGFGSTPKKTAPAPKKRAPRSAAETPTVNRAGQTNYATAATGMVEVSSVVLTLAGADPGGFISRVIGKKQTTALKGDATILAMCAEPLGQAVGAFAPRTPWLATLLEGGSISTDVVVLAVTLGKMTSALIENHRNPSEELAELGNQLTGLRIQGIRDEIAAMAAQAAGAAQPQQDPEPETYADHAIREQHEADQEAFMERQAPQFVSDFAVQHPGQVPGQTTVYEHLAHAS